MFFKKKLKNIICIFILSIILLLIILYLYSNNKKIIRNRFANITDPTSEPSSAPTSEPSSAPTSEPSSAPTSEPPGNNMLQDAPNRTESSEEIEQSKIAGAKFKPFIINKKELLLAIGPCLKIEITAHNMNLVGIILVDNYRRNIFNNYTYKIGTNDNIGKYISTPLPISQSKTPSTTSTTPEPTRLYNTNINDLFVQTNKIDKLTCDFNQNIKDSNNNILLPYLPEFSSEANVEHYILDPKIMFTTPDNTKTTLEINIPQAPNQPIDNNRNYLKDLFTNNIHISAIILCLNNNIDNTIMLNTLKINVFGLNNESIAMWQINQSVDPATNFLRMILNKPNGQDLSMYDEKFLDIPAIPESINASMLTSNDTSTTTIPNTTKPYRTKPYTTKPYTTKPYTTNPYTTVPNTVELTDNGYNTSKNAHTNLFQRDFNGSSNIYSPYIYY